MRLKYLFLLILISCTQLSVSQTRRQETQNVNRDSIAAMRGARKLLDTQEAKGYSAESTRFTYEENFKFNDIVFYSPDTLPENIHRFNDLAQYDFLIQNLGNIGTALHRLEWNPNAQTGVSSGYHAYDEFYTSSEDIRYFDTRSPYTEIMADFGGNGRAKTNVLFTFNDSINFNIGASYKSIRADKQLAYLQRGDRHVKSTDWNIFGFLRPEKLPRYLLLFNMTQFEHQVSEQGGVLDAAQNNPDLTDWEYRLENVILSDAQSKEKRGGIHIYQQYDLDSIFQIYHSGSYNQQLVRYFDDYDLSTSDSLIYSETAPGVSTGTINERTTFTEIINELGFKGRTKKFSYTLNVKNRLLENKIARSDETSKETESFFGGTLRQQITPKIFLKASGEYGLKGNYSVIGNFTSSFFTAEYKRISRRPSFLETVYTGEQRTWRNDFNNEVSDNFYGQIRLKVNQLELQPFTRFNIITNHIFFNETKLPEQANSEIVRLQPGFNLRYQFGPRLTLKNSLYYTSISGGSANKYVMPKWMNTMQIAYRNSLFDGKMQIQTGIDMHYRSSYLAKAYDPVTQQFYLQTFDQVDDMVHLDLFFNFKVRSFRVFAKLNHFNQGLLSEGYYITPWYPGTARTVDLGIHWLFFD